MSLSPPCGEMTPLDCLGSLLTHVCSLPCHPEGPMRMNDGKVGCTVGSHRLGLGGPGSIHHRVPSCDKVSQTPLRSTCHSQTAHRVSRSLDFCSLRLECSVFMSVLSNAVYLHLCDRIQCICICVIKCSVYLRLCDPPALVGTG